MRDKYPMVIPDDKLDEYLEGKLLERPFYGMDTESVKLTTEEWADRQRKQAEERKKLNDGVKRGYNLRR